MVTHISDADVMAAEEHMDELREEAHAAHMLAEAHVKAEPPYVVLWLRSIFERLAQFVGIRKH